MTDTMEAFAAWVKRNEGARVTEFRSYVNSIAQARHVVRKVLRIVDEQAKEAGLEPLQHQALLQIYGTVGDDLHVNGIAERLDIAPAFASRLTKELEQRGLVTRTPSQSDRRVVTVAATEEGVELLKQIDAAVHVHVAYFQNQLSLDERLAALMIFAFYVGLDGNFSVQRALPASP
jgi:DNA-binding MarR family transcriptional regulator